MTDPSKFHLLITAGPSYDPSTHQLVHVNDPTNPTTITSSHLSAALSVRIQNYRGLPTSSPRTSSYFSHPLHKHDLYSISFEFTPKDDIKGEELLFGNDFEKPIKDSLPPGFGAALRVVQWTIDPGLTGDPYGDKPYLYGPLLSSINVLRVGEKGERKDDGKGEEEADVVLEGADGEGAEEIRHDAGVPDDGPKRMKHFLNVEHRKQWTFEQGREYSCDFFNPYLDFNDLALRLPGISLYLMRFWNGEPLRYTLKKKNADMEQELMVVVFTLVPEEELEEVKRKWEGNSEGKQEKEEEEEVKSDEKKAEVGRESGGQEAAKNAQQFQDEGVD